MAKVAAGIDCQCIYILSEKAHLERRLTTSFRKMRCDR